MCLSRDTKEGNFNQKYKEFVTNNDSVAPVKLNFLCKCIVISFC